MQETRWWRQEWGQSFPDGVKLSLLVPVYNERYLVGAMLERLLELEIPGIAAIEIVVVDDGSTDGSVEIVERLAAAHPRRIRFFPKAENEGKGAAIRTAVGEATGDLIVIQDADLEYDPSDLARMVRPFWEDGADVVYGTRFGGSGRRRVVYFRHAIGNRLITFLSNWFTDLDLTDVETCYKMFRGPLLKSIPIRSSSFALEIELTAKIAKRNCTVYEVPISYRGRTYREGKKIGWRDGVVALATILRYWLIDDLYKEDEYGGRILHNLDRSTRFNRWMAATIEPWIGDRVLEIGAGIGNLTHWLIPRDLYVASDANDNYLHYLRNDSAGKPYLEVARVDLDDGSTFADQRGRFDTVVCLNVLEHVRDPVAALRNMREALVPGGRVVLYVPRGRRLYSSLDEALGHRCRYEQAQLESELDEAGLELEYLASFNRASVPGWWWNGKVLRKRHFSRVQLKMLNGLVPVLRLLDRVLPWQGLGIVAVARRPD